jgi:acetylornithine deacetylase/succinyl-diaminopimelate desuccinylase-like protein
MFHNGRERPDARHGHLGSAVVAASFVACSRLAPMLPACSGTRSNVIPERASASVDVRVPRTRDGEWSNETSMR